MTVTLEFNQEEELQLQCNAARVGLQPLEYLHDLIRRDIETPYRIESDPSYSSDWSDEDLVDARNSSLRYLDAELGNETSLNA